MSFTESWAALREAVAGLADEDFDQPSGEDPLDALTVRLAAAYQDPALLKHHLADLGEAAGRAADRAAPDQPVGTRARS